MIIDAEWARGAISQECEAVKALLLAKNREYGNSALEPLNIFGRGDAGPTSRRGWTTSSPG